uniref:F-box protein SKIP28 n=1 Tax=Ananas comosus var. bracteatus TaxID=296719 RepID=A0A6V7P6T3_ANACO|nr:unnamed protein product [Ananas comosus var. bracteatus]
MPHAAPPDPSSTPIQPHLGSSSPSSSPNSLPHLSSSSSSSSNAPMAPMALYSWVCRLLRDAIADDALLWRHITVEPPLSAKLTDEALLRVTSKAEGKLKSLALVDCWNITDAGLLRVVEQNPGITKLYVPGCTFLTADGMVKVVKQLFECKGNLNHLQLRGLSNIRKDHLDIFNSFLGKNNLQQVSQPSFYNSRHLISFDCDDGRPIDVDLCPKCRNVRLVFDCTRESCRTMKYKRIECRGCFFCIARCEACGGCIDFDELDEETACSHILCLECWLQLPKCNTCNRPYCDGHASSLAESAWSSSGFICHQCAELD